MKKLIAFSLVLFALSACSSTNSSSQATAEAPSPDRIHSMYESLPDRYKVPGLEPLERVTVFNYNGWSAIDRRALIIEVGASKKYLIVLRSNSSELRFARQIGIDSDSSVLRTGFDRIYVEGDTMRKPYHIQAIFELDGREGANTARDYIRNYDENAEQQETEAESEVGSE